MKKSWKAGAAIAMAAVTLTALVGCSSTGGGRTAAATTSFDTKPQGTATRPSITEFCGSKPTKVAYIDGDGGNSWRKTTLAEIQAEAAKCKNVTLKYFNASGSQASYISAVDAAIAQNYGAIITYDDFGAAVLPELKKAYKDGLAVVPFEATPGGTPGTDYTGFVTNDESTMAKTWVDWFAKVLHGKGNLVFLGGTPGDLSARDYLDAALKELKKYPGLKMLTGTNPPATNYDIATAQQVMSGLLTKYPKIDGVIGYYGAGMNLGAEQAYIQAGKQLPAFAGNSDTNKEVCLWHQYSPKNPDFQIIGSEGNVYVGRIALRQAVASVEGKKDTESWNFLNATGIDTTIGKIPACQPNLPPDADLWSTLTKKQLTAALEG